jgi:hypothetical protein
MNSAMPPAPRPTSARDYAPRAWTRPPASVLPTLLLLLTVAFVATPSTAREDPHWIDTLEADLARWSSQRVGVIELPFGVRARFNANYTRHLYPSDRLASSFVAHSGPGLLKERSLESRIALSRSLTDNIEVEIAWGARNRVGSNDTMSFQRQTIGALIRITP